MGKLVVTVLGLALLTMVSEMVLGIHNGVGHLLWFNYNGIPFVLSVIVFLIIRQMQISESGIWKILVKLAPYTFGVYLIHDQLMMRGWLWNTASLTSVSDHWTYPFIVVGLCCLIFIVAAFIEAIRKKLFTLLRIDHFISKADRWSLYS